MPRSSSWNSRSNGCPCSELSTNLGLLRYCSRKCSEKTRPKNRQVLKVKDHSFFTLFSTEPCDVTNPFPTYFFAETLELPSDLPFHPRSSRVPCHSLPVDVLLLPADPPRDLPLSQVQLQEHRAQGQFVSNTLLILQSNHPDERSPSQIQLSPATHQRIQAEKTGKRLSFAITIISPPG